MSELRHDILKRRLLYPGEHTTCYRFKRDVGSGFLYHEVEAGHSLEGYLSPIYNHLLFILEGDCTLGYGRYADRKFRGGEMVLLPKSVRLHGRADSPLKFVDMAFDQPKIECDRLILLHYHKLCDTVTYDFQPVPIRPPFDDFLKLLIFFLRSGASCAHLHEMKQKEVFFCLRGFYTKEEITLLFHPIIGKNPDFRSLVYEHEHRADSILEMADLLGMSRSTFIRKFNEEFHDTWQQWKLQRRLERLMSDITNPAMTIKELMARHGFYDHSNFNRFCQRHFGCTVTELIDKHRNGPP